MAISWLHHHSVADQRDPEDQPHTKVIHYHDHTPNATVGWVVEEGRMSKPLGMGKFLRHDELKAGGYFENDSLKFRVKLTKSWKVVM